MPRPLGIAHTSVVVSDMDRSLRFYRDLLRLEVTSDELVQGEFVSTVAGLPDARLRIVLLSAGDRIARLELLEFQSPRSGGLPPRLPALGTSHVALWTDDIHAFYELLTDAGVEAVSPPQTNGAVWAMHVLDPDGIRIELMQMRSEPNSN